MKVLKCKKTGKIFKDIENKSGCLTKHIKKEGLNDIDILSNFIVMDSPHKDVRGCKLCDWTTTDVDNKTGCFENHIKKEHSITIDEYLEQFNDDIIYHKNYISKKNRNEHFTIEENFVICKVCGVKMKTISNTHLKKHNLSVLEYKLKYPNDSLVSNEKLEEFKKNLSNSNLMVKKSFKSKGENDLFDFIKSLNINVVQTYRKANGQEIDIFLPDYNIGIEFNGLFWHTEEYGKNKTYHLNKTINSYKYNIKLIHIFEDEWVNKREIVKKKIKHILNLSSDIKIHGRKCSIKPIKSKIKNDFLNDNHIQGEDRSNIHLGAFNGEELVAVMCFNKKRNMTKNNDNEWELSRFATKYIIFGIAGKLLKYFINEYKPKSIFSFADRRWTIDIDNNLYTKLGFKLVSILEPNYWYYHNLKDRYKRLHKFNYGKSKLIKKHPEYSHMSEWEIMKKLGYMKIWDCGLLKYEIKV